MGTEPDKPQTNYYQGVETEEGETFTFATRAEYDAFLAGFDLGDRHGTLKDWDDGYREGDLVDVDFDSDNLTVRQRVAVKNEDEEKTGVKRTQIDGTRN